MGEGAAPCRACGSRAWIALPDPGPQSMVSDWRVIDEPLNKRMCGECGLAVRDTPPLGGRMYGSDYSLYAHAPGRTFEGARQAQYADWIVRAVGHQPAGVLDVGCGNGSLLIALGERWPGARLLGCDPAPSGVEHGRTRGMQLWAGALDAIPPGTKADVVVSVNVIEHVESPRDFVLGLGRLLSPGGTLVLVCPDGGRPGVELLFADHLSSFAAMHLAGVLRGAGFDVERIERAPTGLGDFQMAVARAAREPEPASTVALFRRSGVDALNTERSSYLGRWASLDSALCDRLPEHVVCFGIGEAAALLRAYAPCVWSRVGACTADVAGDTRFGELPVVPLDQLPADSHLLIGVRPADQAHVAARFYRRFASVVTWYDLVPQ